MQYRSILENHVDSRNTESWIHTQAQGHTRSVTLGELLKIASEILFLLVRWWEWQYLSDRVGRVNEMEEGSAWDIVRDIVSTSILREILISHQWDLHISKVTLSFLDTLTPLLRWFSNEEA